MNNKKFWSTVRPFLANKGASAEHQISINIENEITNDKKHIVELFNGHYINTVQTTSRKKIKSVGYPSNPELDEITVDEIIDKCKNPLNISNQRFCSSVKFI